METKNKELVATVDVFSGPIGGYRFRTGDWTGTTKSGKKFKFYETISHQMSIDAQAEYLMKCAQLALDSGHVEFEE